MRTVRLIAYTFKISIVAASLTLLYVYWDSLEKAYSRASTYVKEVNARLNIREEAQERRMPRKVVPEPGPKEPSVTRVVTAPVQPILSLPKPPLLPQKTQPPVLKPVPKEPVVAPRPQVSPPKPAPLPFEATIRQARDASQKKDYPRAIQLYRMLIKAYPERYEPYGELGNIYYRLRRYEEAGKLYYQAALRLYEAGLIDKALKLQKSLEKIAPQYAKRLRQVFLQKRR